MLSPLSKHQQANGALRIPGDPNSPKLAIFVYFRTNVGVIDTLGSRGNDNGGFGRGFRQSFAESGHEVRREHQPCQALMTDVA